MPLVVPLREICIDEYDVKSGITLSRDNEEVLVAQVSENWLVFWEVIDELELVVIEVLLTGMLELDVLTVMFEAEGDDWEDEEPLEELELLDEDGGAEAELEDDEVARGTEDVVNTLEEEDLPESAT